MKKILLIFILIIPLIIIISCKTTQNTVAEEPQPAAPVIEEVDDGYPSNVPPAVEEPMPEPDRNECPPLLPQGTPNGSPIQP